MSAAKILEIIMLEREYLNILELILHRDRDSFCRRDK